MNDQIYTVVTIIFTLIDRLFTKCLAYIGIESVSSTLYLIIRTHFMILI